MHSLELVERFLLESDKTSRVVTIANGGNSGVLEKVASLPVKLEDLDVMTDFVTLPNLPFDLVAGRPDLKRLAR